MRLPATIAYQIQTTTRMQQTPEQRSEAIEQIGPYQILALLGRGGMGIVLKGRDPKLERLVAIKLMSGEIAHDREVVERFLREARAMARISDTHVVQVYSVDQHEGKPYLAMEFIDASDLSVLLKSRGRQTPAQAVDWIIQATKGLIAAHEVGLLHRDIKLANLLLTSKGIIKVTDFGIALAHQEMATRLTGTGNIVGTPGYLAPEVCLGKTADQRADVYALGVALFELIVGRRPFVADTPMSIMMQAVENEAPDIRQLDASVDAALASILGKMLAKDPEARYQTAREVSAELQSWQHSRSNFAVTVNPLAQVQAYGSQDNAAFAGASTAAQSVAGYGASSGSKLNLLAQSRRPTWLFAVCVAVFATAALTQLWVMSELYGQLGYVSNNYYGIGDRFTTLKWKVLVCAAVSVLSYAAFALWFLKTHRFIAAHKAELRPRDERIALALVSAPILQLFFAYRQFRALAVHSTVERGGQDGQTKEKQGNTILWLWWFSFFGSVGLSILAYYLLPVPMVGSENTVYAYTIELFARGLWLAAMGLALLLWGSISIAVGRTFDTNIRPSGIG